MSDESKANEPLNPRKIMIDTLVKNVFSNAEMSDEDKADASYKMILAMLSKFIPQTNLEARLLNEARALEQGLGPNAKEYDIVIWAKPRSMSKKGVENEPAATEPALISPSEGNAGSGPAAS